MNSNFIKSMEELKHILGNMIENALEQGEDNVDMSIEIKPCDSNSSYTIELTPDLYTSLCEEINLQIECERNHK